MKDNHSLELVFKKYCVNSGCEWIDPNVKSKGYNLFNGKKSLKTVLGVEYSIKKNIRNYQMINETIGIKSNSQTNPLPWSNL